MPAPKRNRFAAKAPEDIHSESLFVRLRKKDKVLITRAAADAGLAEWARDVLVKAAQQQITRRGEPLRSANLGSLGG
jgi:hypothetical protein